MPRISPQEAKGARSRDAHPAATARTRPELAARPRRRTRSGWRRRRIAGADRRRRARTRPARLSASRSEPATTSPATSASTGTIRAARCSALPAGRTAHRCRPCRRAPLLNNVSLGIYAQPRAQARSDIGAGVEAFARVRAWAILLTHRQPLGISDRRRSGREPGSCSPRTTRTCSSSPSLGERRAARRGEALPLPPGRRSVGAQRRALRRGRRPSTEARGGDRRASPTSCRTPVEVQDRARARYECPGAGAERG